MQKADIQRAVREVLKKHPLRHKVRSIALFGSRLRGKTRKNSDVDLLISLREGVGLFGLIGMQEDFAKALGKPVDLVTREGVNRHVRDRILGSAEMIYEER
jgi:uncharacterized protein